MTHIFQLQYKQNIENVKKFFSKPAIHHLLEDLNPSKVTKPSEGFTPITGN